MSVHEKSKTDFGLPDLTSLSETERLQVLAVMQRAKEFEMTEDAKAKSKRPLEGQLTKFTNVMKGWQPRWFILDPESGMLEYFEKEEYKKMRPRGSIHLAAAVVSPSDEDSQTFSVGASNGELYKLRALDARERQQWVDRLRTTAQYHTSLIAQNVPTNAVQSMSILNSQSSTSIGSQRPHRGSHIGSNEGLPSNQTTSSHRHSAPVGRAPMARPHTIDPFKEVKEYMMEAEDYSVHLHEKINSLPQSGEPIAGLDPDLLLLKATSTATLQCLGQCLTMLQQRQHKVRKQVILKSIPQCFLKVISCKTQKAVVILCKEFKKCDKMFMEAYGGLTTGARTVSASIDVHPKVHLSGSRNCSITESNPSPVGSFTSANSLPYSLPDISLAEGPIKHEDEVEDEAEYKDSDLEGMEDHKSIILHLLSQLKLGMDLTKVVLPTFILERRSLLEMFADCMAHPDMFLRIADLPTPEDRMLGVLEWYLTSFHAGRQGSVAKKPYNPIIGETFHCSWKIPPNNTGEGGDGEPYLLTYTAEQVSHHPPVSAFYFECPKRNMCINASIWTKSKFMGMSIGVVMVGKITLKLLDYDEEYVFGLPSAYARSILTTPWVELGDKLSLTCQKSNLNASIVFHTKPFYGGKLHRVTAEVKNIVSSNILCKVQGEWNGNLEFTYGETDTKMFTTNTIPIWHKRVRPTAMQGEFESRKLWSHVTNALKMNDINTATEHKRFLEERQREGEKHRKDTNTQFPTKYFQKVGDSWIYKDMLAKK